MLTSDLAEAGVAVDGVLSSDAVALDARNASSALVLAAVAGGFTLAEVNLAPPAGTGPERPSEREVAPT